MNNTDFVCEQQILLYLTDHAFSLWPPSHLCSLTIPKKQKQTARTSHNKVFGMNTSACRDSLVGTKPLGVKEGGVSLLEGGIFSGTYSTFHSQ